MKCSACRMVAHTSCISLIMNRAQWSCKPSFRDVSIRQYGEKRTTQHHWIHRRTEKGKCKQCGKVSNEHTTFLSQHFPPCILNTYKMHKLNLAHTLFPGVESFLANQSQRRKHNPVKIAALYIAMNLVFYILQYINRYAIRSIEWLRLNGFSLSHRTKVPINKTRISHSLSVSFSFSVHIAHSSISRFKRNFHSARRKLLQYHVPGASHHIIIRNLVSIRKKSARNALSVSICYSVQNKTKQNKTIHSTHRRMA